MPASPKTNTAATPRSAVSVTELRCRLQHVEQYQEGLDELLHEMIRTLQAQEARLERLERRESPRREAASSPLSIRTLGDRMRRLFRSSTPSRRS